MSEQPVTPRPATPLYDVGNPFAANPYPVRFDYGQVPTKQGPWAFVLTLRSGPATLTVHLQRDDAIVEAGRFTENAQKVRTIATPGGNGLWKPPPQLGRPPQR